MEKFDTILHPPFLRSERFELYAEFKESFFAESLQWKRMKRATHVVHIQNRIESNLYWNLFSLHKEIMEHFSFIVVSKERNSYCNPSYAPPNGSNIWIGCKQKTKQYSNSHPIMKIYFQVIFKFTWYATSAFTVKPLYVLGFLMTHEVTFKHS